MFKFGKSIDNNFKELIKTLPKNSEVLDLGSGLGARSIFLAKHGFKVTCLDKDKDVIESIKKQYPNINTINKDILEFDFPQEKYDLVLLLNVLNFFETKNIKLIIKKAIKSLKKNGLLYLQVFSIQDPAYEKFLIKALKTQDKNTFYSKKTNSFSHFFTKKELMNLFSENEILEIKRLRKKDNHPPMREHKHSVIRMIVKK